MYWQVYLHKTVLALQQMLILFLERTKMLLTEGVKVSMSKPLLSLLTMEEVQAHPNHGIFFPQIDDITIIDSIKRNQFHKDKALSYICTSLLERKIFSLQWTNHQKKGYLNPNKSPIIPTDSLGLNDENFSLIKEGTESIHSYNLEEEIFIMYSDQTIVPLSKVSEVYFKDNILSKSFICYPRFI